MVTTIIVQMCVYCDSVGLHASTQVFVLGKIDLDFVAYSKFPHGQGRIMILGGPKRWKQILRPTVAGYKVQGDRPASG